MAFTCPACHKAFGVRDHHAGGEAHCPDCGRVFDDPAAPHTVPPTFESAYATAAPDETNAGDNSDHGPALTAFLAPPQAPDELGRLGNYRVLEILGHGGMGVVFRAEDVKLKRTVALKTMLPSVAASSKAGERFLREAQATAAVEHDNVVRIYQADEDRGVPFLAMEFLRGETLFDRLARGDRLATPETLRVGREIAEGLSAAHAAGLIHRDVKPENVWLESRPSPLPGTPGRGGGGEGQFRVKLLDFGLARAVAPSVALTRHGTVVGTPAYLSPEQARGQAVDARADLFALGVVLYELCTGRRPFEAEDPMATMFAVTTLRPPSPRQVARVPEALSTLVMWLLEKDRERRPATATEVADALRTMEAEPARLVGRENDDTLESPTLPETRSSASDRESPPTAVVPVIASAPRRRRLALLLTVTAVLALVGVAAFAVSRFRGKPVPIDVGERVERDFVCETDDPDFVFHVADGAVTLEDRKAGRKHALKVLRRDDEAGEFTVEAPAGDVGLTFAAKTFAIRRGERATRKAWFARRPAADDAWVARVRALPIEAQVEAFAAKMQETNPGFDGKVHHRVTSGKVTKIELLTDKVTDVSPLRAFDHLHELRLGGTWSNDFPARGLLSDLTPFESMNLDRLGFVILSHTRVNDAALAQLGRCKNLGFLDLSQTQISPTGLAHLARCPNLWGLRLGSNNVGDAGVVHLGACKNLTDLDLYGSGVSDLSPLKGLKLTRLSIPYSPVLDFSAVKNMPLKEIWCDDDEWHADVFRPIKTLERIYQGPAASYWKRVAKREAEARAWAEKAKALPPDKRADEFAAKMKALNPGTNYRGGFDGKVTHVAEGGDVRELSFLADNVHDVWPLLALPDLRKLSCAGSGPGKGFLVDLTPLRHLKPDHLHSLDLRDTRVGDEALSHLAGCKSLTTLDLTRTKVKDVSVLSGLKLTDLRLSGTSVTDLSPLAKLPLVMLHCDRPERHADVLRSIATLKTINGRPADEVLKASDAKKR